MSSDYIVGIDLGTTNSLVAYMQGDSPVVIPGEDGLNLVPSVVALDENNQIVVGNAARKYLIETPERAVYSVKRLMGRGVDDIQDELKLFPFRLAEDLQAGEVLRIKIGERTYTPPEISALVLRQLKRNAERFFGAPVTQAAASGDERCRTHSGAECFAVGERTDRSIARLRSGQKETRHRGGL
jgi:molecular chaperone DnaK (HSP70)